MSYVFGKYELLKKVATGGMAEIWLAKYKGQAGFEKKVIIKKILPHLSKDQEFIERLIDEGKIAVQLTHGNIAQVYDLGEVDGEFFLAMEYIEGIDLRELLGKLKEKNERLPASIAVFILSKVAEGLSYAHNKKNENNIPLNIVHRDISPSNIMLSKDGEVKILDFGIAKAKGRYVESLPGTLRGKFLYLSPEQAGGWEVDGRSDIFSLGIVAYEMLTGVRPFEGKTDLEILNKVINLTPPSPKSFNPEIKSSLEKIIIKCLEKEPLNRYSSAEELHSVLISYLYETNTKVGGNELLKFIAPFISSENDFDEIILSQLPPHKSPQERTLSVERPLPQIREKEKVERGKLFKILIVMSLLIIIILLSIDLGEVFKGEEIEKKVKVIENFKSFVLPRIDENMGIISNRKEIESNVPHVILPAEKKTARKGENFADEKIPTGILAFRYFPADAIIEIDEKIFPPSGMNLVETPLDEGKHTLIVKDKNGKSVKKFEIVVQKNKILNLGTIELGEKDGNN